LEDDPQPRRALRLRRDREIGRPSPDLRRCASGARGTRSGSGSRRPPRGGSGRMRWRRQCRCAVNWDHLDALGAHPIHPDANCSDCDVGYDQPDDHAHGSANDGCATANGDGDDHADDDRRADDNGGEDSDRGSVACAGDDLRHHDERREPRRGGGGRCGGGIKQGGAGHKYSVGLDRLRDPGRSRGRRRDRLVATAALVKEVFAPGSTGIRGISRRSRGARRERCDDLRPRNHHEGKRKDVEDAHQRRALLVARDCDQEESEEDRCPDRKRQESPHPITCWRHGSMLASLRCATHHPHQGNGSAYGWPPPLTLSGKAETA
jgi:hypothetical protein